MPINWNKSDFFTCLVRSTCSPPAEIGNRYIKSWKNEDILRFKSIGSFSGIALLASPTGIKLVSPSARVTSIKSTKGIFISQSHINQIYKRYTNIETHRSDKKGSLNNWLRPEQAGFRYQTEFIDALVYSIQYMHLWSKIGSPRQTFSKSWIPSRAVAYSSACWWKAGESNWPTTTIVNKCRPDLMMKTGRKFYVLKSNIWYFSEVRMIIWLDFQTPRLSIYTYCSGKGKTSGMSKYDLTMNE